MFHSRLVQLLRYTHTVTRSLHTSHPSLITRSLHTSHHLHHSLITRSLHTSHPSLSTHMELSKIVSVLENIAPTRVAADWDNVGLLVEPKQPELISRVLLTNDLTEQVLKEGVAFGGVGMVISYHPPIFRSFKRLTQKTATERIILQSIQSNIAVYSPHTALDNMPNGINDWLLSGLGVGETSSLGSKVMKNHLTNDVTMTGVDTSVDIDLLFTGNQYSVTTHDQGEVKVSCTDHGLVNLLPKIKELSPSSVAMKANTEVQLEPAGGRLLTLVNPEPLSVLVSRIKSHLKLSHVRQATPQLITEGDPVIKSVAVCAGSGGSVLRGTNADLYLTGEMSHHEVLEATSSGAAVVLCDHSNTERGYLQTVYKDKVAEALPGVDILFSQVDSDPLNIV